MLYEIKQLINPLFCISSVSVAASGHGINLTMPGEKKTAEIYLENHPKPLFKSRRRGPYIDLMSRLSYTFPL